MRLLASILAAVPLGWYLLVGLCNIPGLAFSAACGHNGPMWLPILVPVCIWMIWRALGVLLAINKRHRDRQAGRL